MRGLSSWPGVERTWGDNGHAKQGFDRLVDGDAVVGDVRLSKRSLGIASACACEHCYERNVWRVDVDAKHRQWLVYLQYKSVFGEFSECEYARQPTRVIGAIRLANRSVADQFVASQSIVNGRSKLKLFVVGAIVTTVHAGHNCTNQSRPNERRNVC
jgi:hypothetical protein